MTEVPEHNELVSIIIPCYNYAHFLPEAIDSAIRQTYKPIEVIVVDDGSTDSIAQIVKAYPSVHYLRQDHFGLARARNTGLSYSHGAYLLFLDADDRLLPEAVNIGIHTLALQKDCAFTYGLFVSFGHFGALQRLAPNQISTYKELLKRNFIGNPGSVLYNRWVFPHVEGFDETNDPAADYDIYLRIARQFPICCHHKVVVEYRMHGNNMSHDPRVMLKASLTALKHQRQHVAGNHTLSEAYDIGREYWKDYYGEQLIVRTYESLVQGNVLNAARNVCTLIKFYPERFVTFVRRKIMKL